MNILSKIIITISLGIASFFGYHDANQTVQTPITLGDYNPTGGQIYRLQSSISSTQNTLTLTSFKEPVSNIKYTMSYLNSSIEYATINPQGSTKEFVSFTGITQNSDGTALLTGVVRGLGFSYPYTASSTLHSAHSGQEIFILSNPPQLYQQFYNLNNVSTSTNILVFSSTTPPRLDSVAAQAGGTYIATTSEFATVAYVNQIAIAGAANSTESVKGISQLATAKQQASSTVSGTTGASLGLYSLYSTSTPVRGCDGTAVVGALCIPVARNNGTLSPNFIATSSSDIYTFGGTVGLSGISNITSSNIASSTLASSTAYILNAGTINATSTIRGTHVGNGAGLTNLAPTRYVLIDRSAFGVSSGYATSTGSLTIPANTLNASSTIQFAFYMTSACSSGANVSATCNIGIRNSTGDKYLFPLNTISIDGNGETTYPATGQVVIGSNNSSTFSAQVFNGYAIDNDSGAVTAVYDLNGIATMDFTQTQTLKVILETSVGASGGSFTLGGYSIIVNP